MSLPHALILLSLSAFGYYTLHALQAQNGFFAAIDACNERRLLTDLSVQWPEWVPDSKLVGTLIGFFWPVVNGKNLGLSLLGTAFVGQGVAAWALVVVEGERRGSRGKALGVLTFITPLGLLIQTLGFAFIAPIYLSASLLLSSTYNLPSQILPTHLSSIRALPLSLTTGLLIPTLLFALPTPLLITYPAKILFLLIWQAFPLWVTLSQVLFKPLFPSSPPSPSPSSTSSSSSPSSTTTPSTHLNPLRTVYTFALLTSSTTHLLTSLLTLTAAFAPSHFAPLAAFQLHPREVFVPSLRQQTYTSIATGSHEFLKWDYLIGSAAFLVWAHAQKAVVGGGSRGNAGWSGIPAVDILLKTLVFGPLGAALAEIWERDEIVLGAVEDGEGKKVR